MINVLAFATVPPRLSALGPYVQEIGDRGGAVRLVCWFGPEAVPPTGGLAEARQVVDRGTRPGPRRRWWNRPVRSPNGSNAAVDPATQRMDDVMADAWGAEQVSRADFLVALDQDAVVPVWELARANPGVCASFGLYAVCATLAGRLTLSNGIDEPAPGDRRVVY